MPVLRDNSAAMTRRLFYASASVVATPCWAVTMLVLCPLIAWCGSHKKTDSNEPLPVRATLKPSATIPIEPLGFSAPAPYFVRKPSLGAREISTRFR